MPANGPIARTGADRPSVSFRETTVFQTTASTSRVAAAAIVASAIVMVRRMGVPSVRLSSWSFAACRRPLVHDAKFESLERKSGLWGLPAGPFPLEVKRLTNFVKKP